MSEDITLTYKGITYTNTIPEPLLDDFFTLFTAIRIELSILNNTLIGMNDNGGVLADIRDALEHLGWR